MDTTIPEADDVGFPVGVNVCKLARIRIGTAPTPRADTEGSIGERGAAKCPPPVASDTYTPAEPKPTMSALASAFTSASVRGYPIDMASLFEHIPLEVNTDNYPSTDNGTAKIWIGVGTKRSKAEYYSWLLHELRHAVQYAWSATSADKSHVKDDEGPTGEGSGAAVEDLLLPPFLKETLKNDTAFALYALDYGIRDARFAGTTDATLQRYLRVGCADANDLAFSLAAQTQSNVGSRRALVGPLATP